MLFLSTIFSLLSGFQSQILQIQKVLQIHQSTSNASLIPCTHLGHPLTHLLYTCSCINAGNPSLLSGSRHFSGQGIYTYKWEKLGLDRRHPSLRNVCTLCNASFSPFDEFYGHKMSKPLTNLAKQSQQSIPLFFRVPLSWLIDSRFILLFIFTLFFRLLLI